MSRRGRLKRTKYRLMQRQQRVHDLTSAIIPHNAKIFIDEIDDPAGDRANVVRSTRDDPLAALKAQRVIDDCQFLAGQMWQRAYMLAELSGIRAIDFSKETVDGGRMGDPAIERSERARGLLMAAERQLGRNGQSLVIDVIGHGRTLAQAADARGLFTKPGREYIGRRFRECLDCLAVVFGCATSGKPREPKENTLGV